MVGVEDDVEVAFVAEVVLDSAGGGVVAEGGAGGGVSDRWGGGVRGRGVVRCGCVRGGLRVARGVGERCCLVVCGVGLRRPRGGWGSL